MVAYQHWEKLHRQSSMLLGSSVLERIIRLITHCSSSLLRLEASVNQALERQQAAQDSLDYADEIVGNRNGFGVQSLSKQFTDTTLVPEGVMSMSPSARFISDTDSSLTVSDDDHDNVREKARPSDVSSRPRDLTTRKVNAPNVAETIAAVMKEILVSRQSGHASRPLRVEPQIPQHRLDDELRKRFETQKDSEFQTRRHIARDWLRVATWWLLKVRLRHGTHIYFTQLHRLGLTCNLVSDRDRSLRIKASAPPGLPSRPIVKPMSIC